MGYNLKAFIGQVENLGSVTARFKNAKLISLTQQIALIPMTGDLFNEINGYRANNNIDGYEYLTTNIELEILKTIHTGLIAYIEVEYFGGIGVQNGILWKNGKRKLEHSGPKDAVNSILQQFGITRSKSRDEFDTVGLNRHRYTEDWIEGVN